MRFLALIASAIAYRLERLARWFDDLADRLTPPKSEEEMLAAWMAHVREHEEAMKAVAGKRDVERGAGVTDLLAYRGRGQGDAA